MQKSLHIDPAKCTGCLQCEMACSYEHTGTINPSKSRIKVFNFEHEGRKVPYTCTQCADAWCMNACPLDAIVIDAATGTAARGSGDTKKPRRVAESKFSKGGFERRGSVQGCTVGNPADHVCRAFVALCNQMLQCGMTAAGKSVIMP